MELATMLLNLQQQSDCSESEPLGSESQPTREELGEVLCCWFDRVMLKLQVKQPDKPMELLTAALTLCSSFRFRPNHHLGPLIKALRVHLPLANLRSFELILSGLSRVVIQDLALLTALRKRFYALSSPKDSLPHYLWTMAIISGGNSDLIACQDYHKLKKTRPRPNHTDLSLVTAANKLHHAQLYLQTKFALSPAWQKLLNRGLDLAAHKRPQLNGFERGVLEILRKLGFNCHAQKFFQGYWIDIEVKSSGRKLAVECYGDQFHFVENRNGQSPDGRTRMREKILHLGGFEVVRILASEYGFSRSGQYSYVEDQIQKTLSRPVFSRPVYR